MGDTNINKLGWCGLAGVGVVVGLVACAAPEIPDDLSNADYGTTPERNAPRRPSGEDTEEDGGGGTTSSGGTSSGGTTDAGAVTTDAGTDTGTTTTNRCFYAPDEDACFRCCETDNPTALPILQNEYGRCACSSPGVCAGVCAGSFCAGFDPFPGDACDACLAANDATCVARAETACSANPTCKPLLTCDQTAGCEAKP